MSFVLMAVIDVRDGESLLHYHDALTTTTGKTNYNLCESLA